MHFKPNQRIGQRKEHHGDEKCQHVGVEGTDTLKLNIFQFFNYNPKLQLFTLNAFCLRTH
jgi:hypothetical protein